MSERTITIDLNTSVGLADIPRLGRELSLWWLGELGEMMPAWLRARLPKAAPTARLFVRGQSWRIVSGNGGGEPIELDANASDKEIADRILGAAPGFGLSRLTVLLPAETVLRRRVTLPLMSDANLRAAVELQIDRLSPFQHDAIRFDARAFSRDAVEGTMLVDIVIVRRAPVEALEQRLSALGLKPVTIDIDAPDGGPAGFDLRAAAPPSEGSRTRLVTASFAAAALLAWYVAVYAWGAAREREIAGWRSTVEALRPVAARSAALRRELDGLIEPQAVARAHVPGYALNPLLELTKLLPDTVRLSEYRMTGDGIELTGLAVDPPSLIAKLEASKQFKDVKFRSPVVRRPDLGRDRFELSMKLEGGAK